MPSNISAPLPYKQGELIRELQCPLCGSHHMTQTKVETYRFSVAVDYACHGCPTILTFVLEQNKRKVDIVWRTRPL